MFTKLVGWVENHPWITLSAVGAVTVGFVAAVLTLGLSFESDFTEFLPDDDPAVAALNRAEDTYGSQDLFLVSLVTEDTIFKPETLKKFKEMEAAFEAVRGVENVRGPSTADVIYGTESSIVVEQAMASVPETPEEIAAFRQRVLGDRNLRGAVVSEDGRAGAISIELALGADAPAVVQAVERVADRFRGGAGETIYVSGEPVLRTYIATTMTADMQRLIPFVVLVVIAVLFFSFRSVRGIVLPLLVVAFSTVWAVGTMALFDQPITPFAIIMPIMLIAIGAADGIHILNKYYEEAAQTRQGRRGVVLRTMGEMASPVVMTSLTTAAGFLALISSFLWPQRSFGVITAVGILYAMVLSLTLLPALLARLPLPRRRAESKAFDRSHLSNLLALWARGVARHRGWVLAGSLAVLAIFGAAIPQVEIETQPDEFLGENNPVIQAMHVMDDYFGGSRQLAIEIDTGRRDGLKEPAVLEKIAGLQDYLLNLPQVGQVSSVAKISMQMNETLHASDPAFYRVPEDPRLAAQLFLLYSGDLDQMALSDFSKGEVLARVGDMGSGEMIALVDEVNGYLAQTFDGELASAEMVGQVRAFASIVPKISSSQIYSLLAALVVAGLLVALLMRSWVAGLVSVVPLVFTVVVEFGVMAYAGFALDMATLMLGSIAVGIGIDYAIHFISRYKAELRASDDRLRAYERTMRTAGKGIFINALALIFGFAVLLFSEFQGNVNFGRLVILTMAVSSISALTVIPAWFVTRQPAFLKKRSLMPVETDGGEARAAQGVTAANVE